MSKPTMLIGAPGTGKTHRLIQEILDRKVRSFAFLSFTRRAANEAKVRLAAHFTQQELKYVRTIHSFCFALAGLKREQIMNSVQVSKFASEYGFDLHTQRNSLEDGSTHSFMSDDDVAYRQMIVDMAKLDIPAVRDNPLYGSYCKFLKEHQLIDFHQMIARGTTVIAEKHETPKFDLLLVDEFQDLTPIQLAFIGQLRKLCGETIVAADDNQMIFEWAGVDRGKFVGLAEDSELEVLNHNYRLPGSVDNLAHRIGMRQQHSISLTYRPRIKEEDGSVEHVDNDMLDFMENKDYLVLARNNYWLEDLADGLDLNDASWSWLDEEKDTPIKLSTIHGAKGAEADNVVLFTDVSPATYEQIDSDAEHRVWYVAVTRARKKLYIVEPQSSCFYDVE